MNRHPSGYYYPQKLSGAKIFTNCPIYLGPLPLGKLLAENVELVAKESNNQKLISELKEELEDKIENNKKIFLRNKIFLRMIIHLRSRVDRLTCNLHRVGDGGRRRPWSPTKCVF